MEKKEIEHFNETVKSVLTENNLFVTQKYLYHYTDIYGLEGIIKNKELWQELYELTKTHKRDSNK